MPRWCVSPADHLVPRGAMFHCATFSRQAGLPATRGLGASGGVRAMVGQVLGDMWGCLAVVVRLQARVEHAHS